MDQLKALHECVQSCFNSLKRIAVQGLSCETKNGIKLTAHISVTFYVADIPEAEGRLSTTKGNETNAQCHRCFAKKHKLAEFLSTEARSLVDTKQQLSLFQDNEKQQGLSRLS